VNHLPQVTPFDTRSPTLPYPTINLGDTPRVETAAPITTRSERAFTSNWSEYLAVSTFSYNASTNDATGFSPYELVMAKGAPRILQHIDIREPPLAGPPDESGYHERAHERLRAAYMQARAQQERIADARRQKITERRGRLQRKVPKYQKDDHVLYWEPRQSIATQTPAQELQNTWTVKPPQKWSNRWTGPHIITKVTRSSTGHRYQFYHKERGRTVDTHVNKLCLYKPWKEGLQSTSAELDAKRMYRTGEWVPDGELVVVPLLEPYPFGIARVLRCDEDGELELQWLSNPGNKPAGTYKPGWQPPRGEPYYADQPKAKSHKPYTTHMDDIVLNQRDVIIHSFELTGSQRLPQPLLRAIARHEDVWWTTAK
jgi:hypothetical protein